jgi:hypothetical protein
MATAPPKFSTLAKRAKTTPHMMTLKAEYFPSGKYWRRRLVGHSQAR